LEICKWLHVTVAVTELNLMLLNYLCLHFKEIMTKKKLKIENYIMSMWLCLGNSNLNVYWKLQVFKVIYFRITT